MSASVVRVAAICAGLGLIGPVIRAILWPPSEGTFAGSLFVAGLVILLWPLQLLASHEQEGILNMTALVLGTANAVLFAIGGFLVAVASKRPVVNACVAAGALIVFLLWARITVGFSLWESWLALLVAGAVYSCPFVLSRRIV